GALERRQRVVRQDRRGRLGTEPGGDDLGVLRRGQRVAQRVEGEPHEEPPLVMVAALQQRDMQVLTGLERAERRSRQREATGYRGPGEPGRRLRLQDR